MVLLASPLATRVALAQPPPSEIDPYLQAAYRDGEIRLDGRPDEPAWRRAMPATRFVQGEPVENAPPEAPTEVWVLYDEGGIYIGVVMLEPQIERIGDQLVRRDEDGQYDYFELSLDSNNDGRTGYRFRVSAAGVQRDVYLFDDVREDVAWDAVWESAVYRDSTGWSAEIRIPLSQLRYNAADTTQTWGVNFSRRRIASNERTYFALESRIRHGKVSAFGRLGGLQLTRGARRIEVRPYALARNHRAKATPGDPFFDGSDLRGRVGVDFSYGLGAAHTLNLSINPDFGQVEVDPAVINLTAFETFFPEKRPFFVEDARIFDFTLSGGRSNRLFYSRRIGRAPQGSDPDGADFVEIPTETTITGSAKLTGRGSSGFSLGAIAALTGREQGRAFYSDGNLTERFTVEPRSQFGVLRLQQDLRGGASAVGAIFTATNRNLPRDGSFDFLTSNAYSLGLDFEHNWGGSNSRNWALWGYVAGSLIQGSPTALLRVQRAANHYFQRPDATRFSVDSAATSMTGLNWRLQFERRSAKHWTGAVWLGQITPGFEVNDLGFSQSSERLDAGARISYAQINPGSIFLDYRLSLVAHQNWRHEALDDAFSWNSWRRARKGGMLAANAAFQFLNYWGVEFRGRYSAEYLSDRLTRGGPLMTEPATAQLEISLNTDRRNVVFLRPSIGYMDRRRGGRRWQAGLGLVFRPSPSLQLELEPRYSNDVDPAQYVSATGDVGFQPTFGNRYLFSDLQRHQLSVETRLNVTFSPKLTLQLFAQPLVSSGDYLTYKQLEQAESFDFDIFEEGVAEETADGVSCVGGRTCVLDGKRYVDFDADGTSDHSFLEKDFNVISLRMNAVLRWEYRPGSTIFLVWQQSRRDRERIGSFALGRDIDRLFGSAAENMFIVKINYWLGL